VAPSPRPKVGATNLRRYWNKVRLEVMWSEASKTVSHEGADPELDVDRQFSIYYHCAIETGY